MALGSLDERAALIADSVQPAGWISALVLHDNSLSRRAAHGPQIYAAFSVMRTERRRCRLRIHDEAPPCG
jgi:hypothetical protein